MSPGLVVVPYASGAHVSSREFLQFCVPVAYTRDMTSDELRAWMGAHGYSVRTLARDLGVRSSTVQRWRDGSRPIPALLGPALRGLESHEQNRL